MTFDKKTRAVSTSLRQGGDREGLCPTGYSAEMSPMRTRKMCLNIQFDAASHVLKHHCWCIDWHLFKHGKPGLIEIPIATSAPLSRGFVPWGLSIV